MNAAEPQEHTTLAALVERVARGRDRLDRGFVRDLGAWLDQHADRITWPSFEPLGLVDVLLTFHMRRRVKLVITAGFAALPGQLTWTVDERDFPFVPVALHSPPAPRTFSVCTLDYARAGAPIALTAPVSAAEGGAPAGARGVCLVESTHGEAPFCRVRLDHHGALTVPWEHVRFETRRS